MPSVQRQQQRNQAEAEGDCAKRVKPFTLPGFGNLMQGAIAPQRADDPDRHIDVKNPAPIGGRKDQAAQERAGNPAERPGDAVDAEGTPALVRRKGLGQDGRAVHHHQRGAGALHQAEQDQLRGILRDAAQGRTDREDHKTKVVHAHAPEHVRHAPKGQQEDGADQDVGHDDPDHLHQVGMQFHHHVRKRQDHNGAVNRRHQRADGRNTQRDPFVFDASMWAGILHFSHLSNRSKMPNFTSKREFGWIRPFHVRFRNSLR